MDAVRKSAKAKHAKITQTSDGVKFVEVEIETEDFQYLHCRLPLTLGALKKTFLSLLAMGAKMELNENGDVDDPLCGVGSKTFQVEIVNIECDENEAPGSFKTFAKVCV